MWWCSFHECKKLQILFIACLQINNVGGSKLAISVFILFTNNEYLAFSHMLLKPSLPFSWFPANIWNKILCNLTISFFKKLWFLNFVEPVLSWCQIIKSFLIWPKGLLILWCAYWICIAHGWTPFLMLISTSCFFQPSYLPRMKYIFQYVTWDSHLFNADIFF